MAACARSHAHARVPSEQCWPRHIRQWNHIKPFQRHCAYTVQCGCFLRVMAARCLNADHETIDNKSCQLRAFSFPKREFGVTTVTRQSFQPSWFDKWPWLHYCEDSNSVFCFNCMKACSENKLHSPVNAESAFISVGFTDWKTASERFNNHEALKCHREAVLKMVTLPATTQNVGEYLSKEHQCEKQERQQCLLKILSYIRFLARRGLPL